MYKRFETFEPQPEVKVSLDESVILTDKAKLSLYKKSQNSGISVDILEEVYRRGYSIWNQGFGQTPEQFAFDRVNSFIAGGFAVELDEDLKQACWKGYEAVGMKKKKGKMVPNCVPVKEGKFRNEESPEDQDTDATHPHSRLDGTTSMAKVYAATTPGQKGFSKYTTGEHGSSNEKLRIERLKGIVKQAVSESLQEDWSDKKYKNPTGGLTKAGVMAYRREHPGSKLKTAVTTEPSKLKSGSKAANRRKSFCARMSGMKKRLTSAETARDPDSRINKALRKWHCEETKVNELTTPLGTTGKRAKWDAPRVPIRMADGTIKSLPPGKSGSSGGGGK